MNNKKTGRDRKLTRRLDIDEVCLHNKPGSRSITFNQAISQYVTQDGHQLMDVIVDSTSPLPTIIFEFDKTHNTGAKVCRMPGRRDDIANVVVNSIEYTKLICRALNLPEGDHYLRVGIKERSDTRLRVSVSGVVLSIPYQKKPKPFTSPFGPFDIARQQEAKERQRQRLENFTADHTPDIDTCIRVLKAAGYKVMRQEWTEV